MRQLLDMAERQQLDSPCRCVIHTQGNSANAPFGILHFAESTEPTFKSPTSFTLMAFVGSAAELLCCCFETSPEFAVRGLFSGVPDLLKRPNMDAPARAAASPRSGGFGGCCPARRCTERRDGTRGGGGAAAGSFKMGAKWVPRGEQVSRPASRPRRAPRRAVSPAGDASPQRPQLPGVSGAESASRRFQPAAAAAGERGAAQAQQARARSACCRASEATHSAAAAGPPVPQGEHVMLGDHRSGRDCTLHLTQIAQGRSVLRFYMKD